MGASKTKAIKRIRRAKPVGTLEFQRDKKHQCGETIPKGSPWPFAVCELNKGHGGDVHATTGGRPHDPWNVHYWPIADMPE
jgi:hypothetical protein